MTQPQQPAPLKHLDTKVTRDLTVIIVPEEWCELDNDDHIKARVQREVMVMMLTGPRILHEVSGAWKPRPAILGVLRDIRVDLVRAGDDVDVPVEHGDCTDCTDTIETLRIAAKTEGMLPGTITAVVQFTFDEVIGAET